MQVFGIFSSCKNSLGGQKEKTYLRGAKRGPTTLSPREARSKSLACLRDRKAGVVDVGNAPHTIELAQYLCLAPVGNKR